MKKTLKLVLLFIGGLTAIIVGSIAGYLIISNNKTYYIYDVRLVEPIDGMKGYIYTDKEATYTSINNQTVYMNSSSTNIYPIAVYASSSTNSKEIEIKSSDPSIAKIFYKDGKCYVQYLKEGLVTITSELKGVKDSFSIQIYDQIPSEFLVYDYEYYGDYASLFPNTLVSYADGEEYRYKYDLKNISETGSNKTIDGDLIALDEEKINDAVFDKEKTRIDSANNELVISCKVPENTQTENIESTLVLQSFFYLDGEKVIENEYLVVVRVVLYIPEFLQIEVSSTPNFDEGIVYTSTRIVDISSYDDQEIVDNPSLIDTYLAAEKAENYLTRNYESSTYNVYFTERVERLYVRIRMVYTNGDIVYLKNGTNANFSFSNPGLCVIGPTNDYYIMNLDDTYFTGGVDDYIINVSVPGFSFKINGVDQSNIDFVFDYKEIDNSNISLFYDYDNETGIYTYKYWDIRTRFVNEIYDAQGNVIAFGE